MHPERKRSGNAAGSDEPDFVIADIGILRDIETQGKNLNRRLGLFRVLFLATGGFGLGRSNCSNLCCQGG